MDDMREESARPDPRPVPRPAGAPGDATDLVARLRARLAEHEPERRARFDLAGRARDTFTTRRLTRRQRIELIVGVVAFATAVIAATVVLGDSRSPAREPTAGSSATNAARNSTTTRSTVAPAATGTRLMAQLPAAWRATCRPLTGTRRPERPLTALTCAPAAGIRVDVQHVAAGSTARTVAQLASGDPPGPGGAACARDHDGPRTWSASAHPHTVLGHVACVQSGGEARLVWSVDRDSMVLAATRPDGDIASLFTWWVGTTF
jgi:hypothetical protein